MVSTQQIVGIIIVLSNDHRADTFSILLDTVEFKFTQKSYSILRNNTDFVLFRKDRVVMASWVTDAGQDLFFLHFSKINLNEKAKHL